MCWCKLEQPFMACAAGGVLPILAVERPVFYRERAARLYAAFPYAVAQVGPLPGVPFLPGLPGLTPNCQLPHAGRG